MQASVAIILIASIIGPVIDAKQGSTRLEMFRSCTRKNGASWGVLIISNVTITKTKTASYFFGTIGIEENLTPPLPANITVYKCGSSTGRECTPMLKYKHANICPFFEATNSLYTSFVQGIVPSFVCPLKKGNYQMQNCTIDSEKLSTYFQGVPGQQGKISYYLIRLDSKSNNNLEGCFELLLRQIRT